MEDVIIIENSVETGIWFIAWLFTIGFLKLTFWKGVLALIVWPYYLGVAARNKFKPNSN
jgi:hypothetical protein